MKVPPWKDAFHQYLNSIEEERERLIPLYSTQSLGLGLIYLTHLKA